MKLQTIVDKAVQFSSDPEITSKAEAKRNSFLERFPLSSLHNLTIDEYANTKTKDCFIYWLERKQILAGIGGGNSSKFGVYLAKNGEYCKGYGKNQVILQGDKLQNEFSKVKSTILDAITFAKGDRISEISKMENPLFNMVLLKILNLYVPEMFFNIYSPPILIELGKILGVRDEILVPQESIELNHQVITLLKQQEVFSNWSSHQISHFIWELFAERDEKIDDSVRYFLVGHTYGSDQSIKDFLMENNYIATNFLSEDLSEYLTDDNFETIIEEKEDSTAGQKALKQFFSMKEGDYVALKSTFTRKIEGKTKSVLRINAVGRITKDANDGYSFSHENGHLLPVEWIDKEVNEYIGYGGYRSTINQVKNKNAINLIFMKEEGGHELPPELEIDDIPKNYVLFGPPGTGKTYQVVNRAVELIDKRIYEELEADGREALQQYFTRLLKEDRIRTVTFHQSYAYEDFIEGLKSDGKGNFVTSDGLLKRVAIEAMFEGITNNQNDYSDEIRFEQLYDYLAEKGLEQNIKFESLTGKMQSISHVSDNGNLNVSSDDSDGISIVSKARLLKLYRYVNENGVDWKNSVTFIKEAIGGANHTRYWAVFNWIMNKIDADEKPETIGSDLEYEEKKRIVLKALQENKQFDFSKSKQYVVIIDEINRGNISKIFGELLTLLEEDKRLTADNELILELPYSRDKFILPPNLYIIGTMNTADRSIALLDTALRRRFVFEEMMPAPELLESVGDVINVEDMLSIMNKRIEVLYDRDHMIGHAYFINAKTDEEIITIMETKIIPLLQDYFYDDWEKIGLVLGGIGSSKEDPFIIYKKDIDVKDLFKNRPAIHIPTIYRVKKKLTAQELLSIYE
ncbi:McrB family protein [Fredinandcohnia salidurans]|uniref:McrB family protein n=1 Tax=Fredinandcohnia salidurans TaxID=2595041 RepID=A0ABW4MUI2_9BACI